MKKVKTKSTNSLASLVADLVKPENKDERIYACSQSLMLFSLIYFTKYHHFVMPDFHFDMYDDLRFDKYKGVLWVMFRESAKRQPLSAKILTPNGWTTMGELKVGDDVIGSNGKATKITFMSEMVDRPIYELETEDGRKTECDSEHLWNVRRMCNTRKDILKHKIVDTQYLIDSGLCYDRKPDKRNNRKYKEYKFALETVEPVELEEKKLPIEPYFLGLWLGDGTSESVSITNVDYEVKEYLRDYAERLGLKLNSNDHNSNRAETLSITGDNKGGRGFSLQAELRKLGLLGNKNIPDNYLQGSIEQRKALLEGLMDSDGTISSGTASFSNKNEKIIDGVVALVRSLGGRANKTKSKTSCIYKGKKIISDYYRISILFTDYTPFRIERKRKNHKLSNHTFSRIVNIKLVGNKKGRCIRVENKDGLYVTDDYLLTHNTSLAKIKVVHNICYKQKRFMLWASFDEKKAKANLFDIAFELQTNENLASDFGQLYYEEDLKDKKYSTKKSIGEFITANGIKLKSFSTGQSTRGEVYQEFRPDFLVLDDIETMKTMVSEPRTQQVIEFVDELLAGMAGDMDMLILGNRLTNAGSIAYIEKKMILEPKFMVRDVKIKDGHGKITWPEKYVDTDEEAEIVNAKIKDPKEQLSSLETKKRMLGQTVYAREMMNTPLTDEEREFKLEWMQHTYEARGLSMKHTNRYITIDTADSKSREKNDPDFTATSVVDWDVENFWYVRLWKQKRMNAPELIDWIFYLWEHYKPSRIGVEKKAYEDQIKPYLDIRSNELGIYPIVVELKHGGNQKEDRIRGALQGRMEHGKVLFAKDPIDDTDIGKAQLFDFPKSDHDDMIDALAYIDQIGVRPISTEKAAIMPKIHEEFYHEKEKRDKAKTSKDPLAGLID